MENHYSAQSLDEKNNVFTNKRYQQEKHIQDLYLRMPAKEVCTEDRHRNFEESRNREILEATYNLYGKQIWAWFYRKSLRGVEAEDLFQDFLLRLFQVLPAFRWDCSLHTLCFVIAKRVWSQGLKAQQIERGNCNYESIQSHIKAATSRLSTYKLPLDNVFIKLQNEVLSETEIDLLHLKTYQRMSWNKIATIYLWKCDEEEGGISQQELQREASRLRQIFCRAKQTLEEEARKRGLRRGDS